eukprot:6768028-Alexandrium_andersonii.AAC.1
MPGQKLGPVAQQQPVSSIDSERSRADAAGTDQSCHVGVGIASVGSDPKSGVAAAEHSPESRCQSEYSG